MKRRNAKEAKLYRMWKKSYCYSCYEDSRRTLFELVNDPRCPYCGKVYKVARDEIDKRLARLSERYNKMLAVKQSIAKSVTSKVC